SGRGARVNGLLSGGKLRHWSALLWGTSGRGAVGVVHGGGTAGQTDQERGQCDGDDHGGQGDQRGAHRVAPQVPHTYRARNTSAAMRVSQYRGEAILVLTNAVMPHSPPRRVWWPGCPGPGPPPGPTDGWADPPGSAGSRPPGAVSGGVRAGSRG